MELPLTGQIQRITFRSEETGFTIAKVSVPGRRKPVTVVGSLISVRPGETIKMSGQWETHPKFGRQFKVEEYQNEIPTTLHGVEMYLSSGLIPGIGEVMAKRIIKKFGEKTLEIIQKHPEKLRQVQGIGAKTLSSIKKAWSEQNDIRDVMVFLQSHDVSAAYATRIFKKYKDKSIARVKENPYRLATDIDGFGFTTADVIASKLGFPKDSELRAEAGILYTLDQLAANGHVYYPYEQLKEKCREVLEIAPDIIVKAFGTIAAKGMVVIEDLNADGDYQENNKAVYLSAFHKAESGLAKRFSSLANGPKFIRQIDADKAIEWVEKQLDIKLASSQMEAVRLAANQKAMVITGGPGTGKTTITRAIIKIFEAIGVSILLAAPTGRAAKRLSEATGMEAKTIHRLLEYNYRKGGFQKDEKSPLPCQLLIVDEASMIDLVLMYHLVKAIPPGASFIMVGDIDQLPSVGAGNVLKDIIASKCVKVVTLNEIFRQASESSIIVNAHLIKEGKLPKITTDPGKLDDFYFIEQEDPDEVLRIILDLVKVRVPDRFGLDPFEDIQVMAPMHRGVVGTTNLNQKLQETLNPVKSDLWKNGQNYRPGDKVMQIRNNYDKDIFNGDIGRIARINNNDNELVVDFDQRSINYGFNELDELALAYSISIHKSQGSEYPAVILPLLTQHYLLLQRNLIYTAVTRGRSLVIIVGSQKALTLGVQNDRTQRRFTYLKERL